MEDNKEEMLRRLEEISRATSGIKQTSFGQNAASDEEIKKMLEKNYKEHGPDSNNKKEKLKPKLSKEDENKNIRKLLTNTATVLIKTGINNMVKNDEISALSKLGASTLFNVFDKECNPIDMGKKDKILFTTAKSMTSLAGKYDKNVSNVAFNTLSALGIGYMGYKTMNCEESNKAFYKEQLIETSVNTVGTFCLNLIVDKLSKK